jgi:probable O-glycosylation ligase (exosortase A-associated)
MMLDNNDLCLGLAMGLPFTFFLRRSVEKRWLRRLLVIAFALTCVAVVCTLSRGGFLTMCVVCLLIFNKLKKSVLPWLVAALLAGIVPFLLPSDFKERLETLKDPTQEGSAAGRLYAWQVGLRMVAAHPFFGVGFEGFVYNFRRFDPITVRNKDGVKSIRVAHNTYLQVWAELGTVALVCFLGMLISALLWLRRTREEVRRRGGPQWLIDYADMIEISLLAFMFGANFLNRAHFDLMYTLVGMSACLRFVAKDELLRMAPPASIERPVFGTRQFPASALIGAR